MKRPSGWIIFVGLLAVPAAIYYSYQLWSLWTNTAELNAFIKTEKVELPFVYREYLRAVDSPVGRKQLSVTYDAAAKDRYYAAYPSDLEALRKFTESVPIFSWRDTDVITVKIVNVGRKAAKNVKVFFPAAGFAEVTKDGTALSSTQTKAWLELKDLEPSSQFIVKLWPAGGITTSISEVRLISDDGSTRVQTWNVSRDENRWVIAFGVLEIFFWGIMGLLALCIVLAIIVSKREGQVSDNSK